MLKLFRDGPQPSLSPISQLRRPALCAVQNSQSHNHFGFHAVDDHIRCVIHHQFARALDSTRPSDVRMLSETPPGCFDCVSHANGGPGITFLDIGDLAFAVVLGDGQPFEPLCQLVPPSLPVAESSASRIPCSASARSQASCSRACVAA